MFLPSSPEPTRTVSTSFALASDSHGATDYLDALLANLEKNQIRTLVHAGDFVAEGVEEILARYSNIQIFIARGNADVDEEIIEAVKKLPHCTISETVTLEFNGVKIAASHIEGIAEGALRETGVKIFCHGHTHRAKLAERNGALILNPGSLQEEGKYMLVEVPSLKVERRLFRE